MELPKDIREHLARAKAYLQDDAIARALESISIALRNISSLSHIPSEKALEKHINTALQDISAHPHMQILLPYYALEKSPLYYERGKEGALIIVLQEFAKMFQVEASKQDREIKALEDKRLQDLLHKSQTAYAKGEWAIGTSFLQRAAMEFEAHSQALNYIGSQLAHAKQYLPAAKVFKMAVKSAPRDMENYTLAINNFILAEDYAGAEYIFKLALRQFGGHPRTHGRMATLYLLWKKFEEAHEFAKLAIKADPEEKYALQVLKILNQAAQKNSN